MSQNVGRDLEASRWTKVCSWGIDSGEKETFVITREEKSKRAEEYKEDVGLQRSALMKSSRK